MKKDVNEGGDKFLTLREELEDMEEAESMREEDGEVEVKKIKPMPGDEEWKQEDLFEEGISGT